MLFRSIRPWIQDFGYGSFRAYTAEDVLAEMQALRDNGAGGWMIWNARAIFTEAALGPPRDAEAAGTTTISVEEPAASGSPEPTVEPSGSGSPSPSASP